MDDAYDLAQEILKEGMPQQGLGYSRGGLVFLNAFRYLEEIGRTGLIPRLILVGAPVNGISPHTARIAQMLGLRALQDLCPNSEAVNYWRDLSPTARGRIIVLSSLSGDVFTTAEGAYVEGATNIFDRGSSHQEKVMNRNNPIFRMLGHLIKDSVVSPN